MAKAKSYQKKQRTALTSVYIILTILAVFWMFPIVWIILTSFRGEGGAFVPYIIPKTFTLENYKVLLTNQTGNFPFVLWFLNTLFVSIASCLLSTFITIAMAYALSRLKTIFKSGARFKYVPWFYEHDCRLLYFKSLKFN